MDSHVNVTNLSSLACLDDRRQLHEKLWLHPETVKWDESPETGHEPCRQAPSLPFTSPPQLEQEDGAANGQDFIPARGSWGRSPRHSPLTGQTHEHWCLRQCSYTDGLFGKWSLFVPQITCDFSHYRTQKLATVTQTNVSSDSRNIQFLWNFLLDKWKF